MRYFRTYPWGLQLLLFVLMAFTFLSAASVIIGSLMPKLSGFMPSQLEGINPNSSPALINAAIIVQGTSSVVIWLLPAFLFAYLAHPNPAKYLGLRAPGKMIQPILAILIMLGAMPVLEMLSDLISHINFGAAVKASQQENEDIMNAFLVMPSAASLIKVFLVLAIVPAMGEEMFFRGVLMRFAKKRSNSMVLPIVFTAFVFAFAHASVYGFLSIFIAGILLAFIYNLTGSLWCSILAHLFFNGSQIVLSYLSNGNAAAKQATDNAGIPYYLVAAGAVVFGISFYLLLKNKTPLPPNWTDDFTPAELQQEQNLNSK